MDKKTSKEVADKASDILRDADKLQAKITTSLQRIATAGAEYAKAMREHAEISKVVLQLLDKAEAVAGSALSQSGGKKDDA